jgi:hypothetical protein
MEQNITTQIAFNNFFEKINRVDRDINKKINVGIWIQFWLVIEKIFMNIDNRDNRLCLHDFTLQNINQCNKSIQDFIEYLKNQNPRTYMEDKYCGGSAHRFDEDLNEHILSSIYEEIDGQENGERELNNYPLIEYINRDTTQYLFYIIFNNHLRNEW